MSEDNRSSARILIVEDEPSISEVCRRVLTRAGLEVDVAANGRVAQEMISATGYRLCLVDIMTPAMNGKELYQWLAERYPRLAGGVIFTSGDTMNADTRGFLEQSARPFLPKPFTPDELVSLVRQSLGGGY